MTTMAAPAPSPAPSPAAHDDDDDAWHDDDAWVTRARTRLEFGAAGLGGRTRLEFGVPSRTRLVW
jgi:predicted cobalt transporter CbtA